MHVLTQIAYDDYLLPDIVVSEVILPHMYAILPALISSLAS